MKNPGIIINFHRNFLKIFIIFLCLLTLLGCSSDDQTKEHLGPDQSQYFEGSIPEVKFKRTDTTAPNIILISLDTLRWDSIFNVQSTVINTPALKEFKKNSLKLRNVISTTSWTLPSHASLLTGLSIEKHGAYERKQGALHPEVPTFSQYLRKIGYRTAGFVDGSYVSAQRGFGRGFEVYWEQLNHIDLDKMRLRFRRNIQKSKHWLRERSVKSKPIFLFLHTYQIHDYHEFYPGCIEKIREESPNLAKSLPTDKPELNSILEWDLTPRKLKAAKYLYDCGFNMVDQQLDNFFDFLKQENLYNSSYIIVFSDHGEGFSLDRGIIQHGSRPPLGRTKAPEEERIGQLNESLIRVPFLVKFPENKTESASINWLVSIKDILPALLDSIGITSSGKLLTKDGGDSFKAAVRERVNQNQFVRGAIQHKAAPKIFLRGEKYKATYTFSEDQAKYFKINRESTTEKEIGFAEIPERRRNRIQSQLEEYANRFIDNLKENNTRRELTADQEKNLQGLGYM